MSTLERAPRFVPIRKVQSGKPSDPFNRVNCLTRLTMDVKQLKELKNKWLMFVSLSGIWRGIVKPKRRGRTTPEVTSSCLFDDEKVTSNTWSPSGPSRQQQPCSRCDSLAEKMARSSAHVCWPLQETSRCLPAPARGLALFQVWRIKWLIPKYGITTKIRINAQNNNTKIRN